MLVVGAAEKYINSLKLYIYQLPTLINQLILTVNCTAFQNRFCVDYGNFEILINLNTRYCGISILILHIYHTSQFFNYKNYLGSHISLEILNNTICTYCVTIYRVFKNGFPYKSTCIMGKNFITR